MIQLTLTQLNLYQDCPRCFWVEIHDRVLRPGSGDSTLPSGINLAFKKYTDTYRNLGKLPPELTSRIDGTFLPDQELMKKWRDHKYGLRFSDEKLGVELIGILDECIVKTEGSATTYIPLDFKTKGFDNTEETHDHHAQLKLDCYDLMLQKNGYATNSTGYLVYYVPQKVQENGVIQFLVQVIQLVTEPQRIQKLLAEVLNVLQGQIPEAGKDCVYCQWGDLGAKLSSR